MFALEEPKATAMSHKKALSLIAAMQHGTSATVKPNALKRVVLRLGCPGRGHGSNNEVLEQAGGKGGSVATKLTGNVSSKEDVGQAGAAADCSKNEDESQRLAICCWANTTTLNVFSKKSTKSRAVWIPSLISFSTERMRLDRQRPPRISPPLRAHITMTAMKATTHQMGRETCLLPFPPCTAQECFQKHAASVERS